jgi:hypothetical protein
MRSVLHEGLKYSVSFDGETPHGVIVVLTLGHSDAKGLSIEC